MNSRKDHSERLSLELENKRQVVRDQDGKIKVLEEETKKRSTQVDKMDRQRGISRQQHRSRLEDITILYARLQETNSLLQERLKEAEKNTQHSRNRINTLEKSHQKDTAILKDQIELTRSDYTSKIKHLEDNLAILKQNYHLDESVSADRQQIIRDSYRESKTKSKEAPTVRGVMIQNQQLATELEYQSQQIVIMLQKIEKSHQQTVHLKRQIQIQKQIQSDLLKRYTGVHNVIKQLSSKFKELETENQGLREKILEINSRPIVVYESNKNDNDLLNAKTEFNLLSVDNSKLKNEINYLQNKIRLHQGRFQGLAFILAQYLDNLLLTNKNVGIFGQTNEALEINLADLKNKEVVQWKPQQTTTVVYLLLTQIKSVLSKKNLISLPDVKSPNISIIQESSSKQVTNLPKIATQYQEMISLEHRRQSRFKGIPLDISTKIVRSELRNWGKRLGGKRNQKSLSMYSKNEITPV